MPDDHVQEALDAIERASRALSDAVIERNRAHQEEEQARLRTDEQDRRVHDAREALHNAVTDLTELHLQQ